MPNNYILLDRIELNATTASVTFDNIPQTGYTDLKISISARTSHTAPSNNILIQPNGLTTNLSSKRLAGTGSAAASYDSTTLLYAFEADGNGATTNTFSNGDIYIPNYRGSTFKSFSGDGVMETNATTAYMTMSAGLWSSTAAITSLTFIPESGYSFLANSTFSLYGLAAVGTTPAIAPKADGGNVIGTDGTYWYHAFLSNGTFTPQVGLNADVLVVAGGGGGGAGNSNQEGAGGGGAGGVLGFSSQALSLISYTCTIGAGGAGGTSGGPGIIGVNSQFSSLTASVGGGRGGDNNSNTSGGNGGSGGGAGGYNVTTASSPTSGQGFAGGVSTASQHGGGGGGAGGAGVAGGSAGAGGASINTYTNATWLSSALSSLGLGVSGYIAGGGGGGGAYIGTIYSGGSTGGTATGGGGAGGTANSNSGVSATANTGSGGGGGSAYTTNGGAGGSGLIIIRYPIAS